MTSVDGKRPNAHAPTGRSPDHRLHEAIRFACFVVMAVIGFAALALALLAEPIDRYYRDQAVLRYHQARLDALQQRHDQQQELLAHVDTPSVIERYAMFHFGYEPFDLANDSPTPTLTGPDPQLLCAIDSLQQTPTAAPSTLQQLAAYFTHNPKPRKTLLTAAIALVLIALVFFYRQRHHGDEPKKQGD